MSADQARIHDESRAEHYVYQLIGHDGELLYIGCSMNLRLRMIDHRRDCQKGHLIAAVETAGPYSFKEARRLEREQIEAEQPPFNIEWTRRDPRFKRVRSAS